MLSHRLQNSCLGQLRKYMHPLGLNFLRYKKVSGFNKEVPQSHTADQPMARDEEPQNNNNHKHQATTYLKFH